MDFTFLLKYVLIGIVLETNIKLLFLLQNSNIFNIFVIKGLKSLELYFSI